MNWLRLYGAGSSADFDIQIFNEGDYFRAVEQKVESETITKMLYPLDTIMSGRELRLVQEYFLVACTLKDIIRRYMKNNETFRPVPRTSCHPDERHPSLPGSGGTDETSGGRICTAMGPRLGDHPTDAGLYQAIRCWPKRWKNGRQTSSKGSFPAIYRSFMKSTVSFSKRLPPVTPTTANFSGACLSSKKGRAN